VRAPAPPGTRCLAPPAHATLNATRSPGSTRVGKKAWDDRLIGQGVSTYLEEPDERRRWRVETGERNSFGRWTANWRLEWEVSAFDRAPLVLLGRWENKRISERRRKRKGAPLVFFLGAWERKIETNEGKGKGQKAPLEAELCWANVLC